MQILGISGSLRKASTNTGILKYMALHAPDFSMEMEIADLTDIPFLNTDKEQQDQKAAVQKLLAQIEAADAFVFASPEYNYSLAPALKNALDWGSRAKGNVLFKGKAASIVSSAGGAKGVRSQHHLRQVGVFLDLHFLNKPEIMFSAFDGTFDSDGKLVNEECQKKVLGQLVALKGLCLQLSS